MSIPPSPFRQILDRSMRQLQRSTVAAVKMDITPTHAPLTIYSFHTQHPEPLYNLASGSDVDIGGLSTCHFTQVPNSHLAFHGTMSLQLPPALQGKIRTGYAAFRNRNRPTLFGEETWDLQPYTHLRVVVGYRGWEGWRGRWSCNVQTDGPVKTDLWQHRLDLPPSPLSTPSPTPLNPLSPNSTQPEINFTTLHLPLSSFVLTNSGQTAEQQIPMLTPRVRTIGFGLLGAGRGGDGMPLISGAATEEEEEEDVDDGWGENRGLTEVDRRMEARRDRVRAEASGESSSLSAPASGVSRPAISAAAGGYHRVTSQTRNAPSPTTSVRAEENETEMETAEVRPNSSGYYELCVRSVEAVKWDPEGDEIEGE